MTELKTEREVLESHAIYLLLDVIDGSHQDIRTKSARDLRPLLELPYVAEAVWDVLRSMSRETTNATPLGDDMQRVPTPLEIMGYVQQLQGMSIAPTGEAA